MTGSPAASSLVNLVLAIGAAARLTRLITMDVITAPLRARVMAKVGDPDHYAAVLVRCPWCMGVWIGALVGVWSYLCWGHWYFTLPALVLTCAQAAGHLGTRE
jgi:hypothetical protein